MSVCDPGKKSSLLACREAVGGPVQTGSAFPVGLKTSGQQTHIQESNPNLVSRASQTRQTAGLLLHSVAATARAESRRQANTRFGFVLNINLHNCNAGLMIPVCQPEGGREIMQNHIKNTLENQGTKELKCISG